MGRPTTLPAPWAALAAAYGGVSSLADACGVTRSAIARWASGERTPPTLVQQAVNAMAKRRKLDPPFAR